MPRPIPLRRRSATAPHDAPPATSPARGTAPTCDAILRELSEAGVPLAPVEVASRLRLGRKQQHVFDACVATLERDGALLVNRKGELCIVAKLDLVTGTIQGHPDGFGFLVPDAGGDDLFLSPREMHKALHGDRVTAKRVGVDRRGRPEGEIVDVISRANREVVGRIHEERGVWFVEAENRRINQDLMIPPGERGSAQPGQVVVVEIVEPPSEHREAIARVKEVLGSATDSGIEIEIALRKHALPFEWSAAAARQAQRLPPDVRPADRKDRTDLTHLPLVTIDGETAKDFDDAVYCEPDGRGYRLIVAIADVSHYVRDGDALDADARERGTSVYFPRRVIPMLPEALSNELCSLKPDVDRLCMACDMRIDARGTIKSYSFYPAVMHSRARLTYTQVYEWLTEPGAAKGEPARSLLPHLSQLFTLYRILFAARERRGAIDFDTVELALEFDEHGKIVRIVPAPRNDAHKLIEECMLAANVCAAGFLAEHEQPALYRIHEGPPPEKLAALREFLGGSALTLTGGDEPSAMDYAALIDRIRERPDFALLQTVLLRSLSQAQYSPANVGHFGLAYDAYAHFTSPIRRYPDLLVHRAIKAVLAGRHEPRRAVPRGELRPPGGSAAANWPCGRERGGIALHAEGFLVGGTGSPLLADRAARRRRVTRRAAVAQVPLHAGKGRRDVHRHDQRRGELRHFRDARRTRHRRAGPRDGVAARLFPLRRGATRADRRAQRSRIPARRARQRQGGARGSRAREDRLHARRSSDIGRAASGDATATGHRRTAVAR